MRLLIIVFILTIIFKSNVYAQNQLWGNVGYGRYLLNSENSLKVLEEEKLGFFIDFGFGYQRDAIFGMPFTFEYNYFQITQEDVIKSFWTDETGVELGELNGDYQLINHTFDFDYFDNINEKIAYGIGPSFVITNRILDIDLSMITSLQLYDKLASSGAGINGYIRYTTSLYEPENEIFFTSILKLRYTHSIWFDQGLRNLDNYKQEFFTANLSIGIGFNFGD